MKDKKPNRDSLRRNDGAVQQEERLEKAANAAAACPVPVELLQNLKYEYLRRELWVPLKKENGRITVLLDEPRNILKRDMIESLLKTKTIDYQPATAEEIIAFIGHFFDLDEDGVPRDNGED
ncbi:MAG: hypothetical protein RBT20_13005, partial [Syntrophales bacterium]|nr:hypothetical protein [Syntrophales bacterium]